MLFLLKPYSPQRVLRMIRRHPEASKFVGGLSVSGAGTLCAVLSGLAAWYFFIPPGWTFVVGPQGALALAFYVVIVSVDIVLIHYMHTASARLQLQQPDLALAVEVGVGLVEQQKMGRGWWGKRGRFWGAPLF